VSATRQSPPTSSTAKRPELTSYLDDALLYKTRPDPQAPTDNDRTRKVPRTQRNALAPSGPPIQNTQRVSDHRNEVRSAEAKERDRGIVGKYSSNGPQFPSSTDKIFGPPIQGPDDAFHPPPWLLKTIKGLIDTPVPTPRKPPIRFETSPEALAHNTKLLQDHDLNFEAFVTANMGHHHRVQLGVPAG
jgi:hypothetical protein